MHVQARAARVENVHVPLLANAPPPQDTL
jgi:hypothetical protein